MAESREVAHPLARVVEAQQVEVAVAQVRPSARPLKTRRNAVAGHDVGDSIEGAVADRVVVAGQDRP
jgi:hypothetical protein